MTPTCETCRYYHSKKTPDGVCLVESQCRRRAPFHINQYHAQWCRVDSRDWCGEHAPKDKDQ